MVKKNTTLEDLARMIQAGFQETAAKEELAEFRQDVNQRLNDHDERFKLLVEGLDIIRADIHDMKITLGPLVRTVAQMEDELRNVHSRIARLERKVGIAK